MQNKYDNLEKALELASYRLPLTIVTDLIAQVEDVILTNGDSVSLEHRIHDMVYDAVSHTKMFDVRRLAKAA